MERPCGLWTNKRIPPHILVPSYDQSFHPTVTHFNHVIEAVSLISVWQHIRFHLMVLYSLVVVLCATCIWSRRSIGTGTCTGTCTRSTSWSHKFVRLRHVGVEYLQMWAGDTEYQTFEQYTASIHCVQVLVDILCVYSVLFFNITLYK